MYIVLITCRFFILHLVIYLEEHASITSEDFKQYTFSHYSDAGCVERGTFISSIFHQNFKEMIQMEIIADGRNLK